VYDVVVVGAGPVGLFLACELRTAGSSVLVLERQPELHSPWRSAPLGLRGLSAASVEAFHRRALLPALLKASGAPQTEDASAEQEVAPPPRSAGHFAGMVLDPSKIDVESLPFRLPSPALEGMMTSLDAVETVLSDRAAELGVEIRRGDAVTGLAQGEDSIVVRAGDTDYTARWVVGCDGGRSTVRKLGGFDFIGTDPLLTGYVVLADIADPDKIDFGFNLTPTGMYVRMPAEGHFGMMDFDAGAFDRSQPPTREHLQTVLRKVSGTDVTLNAVHLASSFTDRAMQTTTYRNGRVLLAGDAAHIHSPLGGQGLNLGLADALNLGWKLAATAQGTAPPDLLDTYALERHPVGAAVLEWSRAQAAVMQPGSHARALQTLVGDLLDTQDGATHVYRRVSGASIRYDLGRSDALVGRHAPEFRLTDGTSIGDLLPQGRGLVMNFRTDPALSEATKAWDDRLQYVEGRAKNDLGYDAVLIRPDGVVVWARSAGRESEPFETAAARWLGTPGA